MTLTRRPAPLAEVVTLRDAMERLFDDRFFRPLWPLEIERQTLPPLDLFSTPEAVIARVAMPGVDPKDVDISIAEDVVTISGTFAPIEPTEPIETGFVHRELAKGAFSRTFTIPAIVKVDQAKASFKNGLLTLTMPKAEAAKPTHVTIEAG